MAEDDIDEDYEDDAGMDGEDGEGGGKGGKKKLILLILLPLLLVIGGVAGAYFAGLMDPVLDMFGGGEEDAAPVEGEEHAGGGEGEEGMAGPGGAIFYDLDQIVVDLNSSGRRRSYLQMRLSLQLENQQDVLRVEEAMPRIMDNFITFLRELRLEDLQGTAGMYRIQEELLIRVNNAAAPARVKDVLFKEMLIQ